MDTTFNAPSPDRRGLRDLLLSDSLLKSLQELMPRYIDDLSIQPQQDDTGGLDALLRLSALQTGRWAKRRLFVGLNGNAADHLGRNLLICTRPLGVELSDFAARHGLSGKESGNWINHVLSNFEKVLFLDRFHFGQSASLSPWIQPNLIDRFPIRLADLLPQKRGAGRPRVLLIDHRDQSEPNQRPLPDAYAALEAVADLVHLTGTEDRAGLLAALSADIHLHHGFSNHRAAELSPIDSMAASIYTIVLPQKTDDGTLLGDEAQGFIADRSYAREAQDRSDALRAAEEMALRIQTILSSGLPFNPETRRAQRLNDEFLAQKINMLKSYILQ